MIEMRWLVRPGWDGPENILQYRQMVDKNIYSGFNRPENVMPNMQWSDWADVPVVEDKQ